MGVVFDITERKRAEKDLNAALVEIRGLKERLEEENFYLREEIFEVKGFDEIVGKSDALKYVLTRVEQVAKTDATVLLQGETGVGKELIARAIHERSSRSNGPQVKVNCATLPEALVESELFGHEKGAFTSADRQRKGPIRACRRWHDSARRSGRVAREHTSEAIAGAPGRRV